VSSNQPSNLFSSKKNQIKFTVIILLLKLTVINIEIISFMINLNLLIINERLMIQMIQIRCRTKNSH
jgi:hypothetical protein